jgi:hypothetical protein
MLRFFFDCVDPEMSPPSLESMSLELSNGETITFDKNNAVKPSWTSVLEMDAQGLYYFFIKDGRHMPLKKSSTVDIPAHSILHVGVDDDCEMVMHLEFVYIATVVQRDGCTEVVSRHDLL